MQQQHLPAPDARCGLAAALDSDENRALEDAAREALPSVVHVYTLVDVPAESGEQSSAVQMTSERSGGTGVVIDPEGIILTNEHVVRDAAETWVVLGDGSWHAVARVTVDDRLDLAILRIEASGLRAIAPSVVGEEVGKPVVAIGCTAPDESAYLRPGRITDTAATLQAELDPAGDRKYDELIASSVVLVPGFSGGPLLDAAGRLIGLTVAASNTGGEPRGYAIPFDQATLATLARLAGTEDDEEAASEAW
jgi:S1-C subfamily serine protease